MLANMKGNVHRQIALAANVAVIIAATLLCAVLVKNYLLTGTTIITGSTAASNQNQIQAGVKLSVPGIDWAQNNQTLLLALSTTCHFCTESGPFYQRLVKEHGDTQLIGLLPQSVVEGHEYLKKLGVEVGEVRQISMSDLGLSGTPTLILVDNKGMVLGSWVGKLSADKEAEVLSKLE